MVTEVSQILRAAFERHGDHAAVEIPHEKICITYYELFQGAKRWSLGLGHHSGSLVINLGKCREYYELLAYCFLWARPFCPVDLSNPPQRVAIITHQLNRPLVITTSSRVRDILEQDGIEVFQPLGDFPPTKPSDIAAHPEPSAEYFIATSGSTGTPRLVRVAHDVTTKFIEWPIPFYRVQSGTRWAQFSSIGFDLSLVDFLTVIGGGGTLIAVTLDIDRGRPADFIMRHHITHWHSVPSILPLLLDGAENADISSLQCTSFCGEPLIREFGRRLRALCPETRIINTYGPTEGTLFCSAYEVENEDLNDSRLTTLPIGVAIPGWNLLMVEDGDFFRLVIISPNIALGYLNTKSLSFGRIKSEAIDMPYFDTGDYFVYIRGKLCFSHRRDGMIKVKGNRVDLAEITDIAASIGLRHPVAILAGARIVLFHERQTPDVGVREIMSQLSARLPSYALPGSIVEVEQHPRTINGKIDRGRLLNEAQLHG